MQNNNPYEYAELREEIHYILNDFFEYEYELFKNGEFDHEFLEASTDNILRLIRRQGGQV